MEMTGNNLFLTKGTNIVWVAFGGQRFTLEIYPRDVNGRGEKTYRHSFREC